MFDRALFVKSFCTKFCENPTKALVADISLQTIYTWLPFLYTECLGHNTHQCSNIQIFQAALLLAFLSQRFTIWGTFLLHDVVKCVTSQQHLTSVTKRTPSATNLTGCCAVTISCASEGYISFFVTLMVTEFCGITEVEQQHTLCICGHTTAKYMMTI